VTWLKRKLIFVCLEIVLILAQNSCSVCADRTIGRKSFWTYPMELLGDVDQVESHFPPLEIVLERYKIGA
jgi:hypothetical protein